MADICTRNVFLNSTVTTPAFPLPPTRFIREHRRLAKTADQIQPRRFIERNSVATLRRAGEASDDRRENAQPVAARQNLKMVFRHRSGSDFCRRDDGFGRR